MYHSKLSNQQLVDLLISYAETAYYYHDSTKQEEARLKIPTLKKLILDRMR